MTSDSPNTSSALRFAALIRRAKLVLDAMLHPRSYFRCTACGSWPWHNSWARIELGRTFTQQEIEYAMPEKPLGGCCSGAD